MQALERQRSEAAGSRRVDERQPQWPEFQLGCPLLPCSHAMSAK